MQAWRSRGTRFARAVSTWLEECTDPTAQELRIKISDDYRRFCEVVRGSREWNILCSLRGSVERVFGRLKGFRSLNCVTLRGLDKVELHCLLAVIVMQAMALPYRVVAVCTGDLGRGQAKKFDIEAWMPSRKNYCETHSASKFYEFQARRLNMRYKDSVTKKNTFCHTLHNTVIASPRILIPIMELYQNSDGTITIPQVLRQYMADKEQIDGR